MRSWSASRRRAQRLTGRAVRDRPTLPVGGSPPECIDSITTPRSGPDDDKAYYVFERVHSELIVADLTADCTDVTGTYSTHFPHGRPPFAREAPAYFRRHGRRYLITSGTTGY